MKYFKVRLSILFFLILLAGCASKTFEWVKINPRTSGRDSRSQTGANRVNLNIYLKEKNANPRIIYNDEFPSTNQLSKIKSKSPSAAYRSKRNSDYKKQPNKKQPLKNRNSKLLSKERTNLQNNQETFSDKPLTNGLDKTSKIADSNLVNEGRKLADSNQIPGYDDEIRKAETEKLKEKKEAPKKNNYLWIGLLLVIIGLITGLIYGGWAYLISLFGIILLVIGYLT